MQNETQPQEQTAPVFLSEHPVFDQFAQQLFGKLVDATRISNEFPEDEEYNYSASFRPFREKMSDYGRRLANLTQKFMDQQQVPGKQPINDAESFYNQDLEDIIDQFDSVVDFVDNVIEKVDIYADELTGRPNPTNIVTKYQPRPATTPRQLQNRHGHGNIFHASTISRPQLKFEDKTDNSNTAFIPKITYKPNAMRPLDDIYQNARIAQQAKKEIPKEMEAYVKNNLGLQTTRRESYPHPYEYEIDSLKESNFPMTERKEQIYKSLSDTPCTWVTTLEQLKEVAAKLDNVTEFAVDLEAHGYRTFQGFVCLMQVSTRTEDFLIDTLELRHHLHILNSSFTNPNIIKVLHGADSDIVWLQRDFGLYIVNLFDTGQAARVLEFPSFALAYLLKFYCNVTADKKYQLADWRIRPLPEEMLRYAKEDTHYLLYIFDRLRNDLIARGNSSNNLLLTVWNRSKEISKRKYEKDLFDEHSHLGFYNKYNLRYNPPQMRVFKNMYKWRDRVAREEDESTRYVLPNHMLFQISELMPEDVEGLFSCCNPVPPLVRLAAHDLVYMIVNAKKEPEVGEGMQVDMPSSSRTKATSRNPVVPPLPISGLSQALAEKYGDKDSATSMDDGTLHSPVLTTEQLYKTAGWIEEKEGGTSYVPKRDIIVDLDTRGGALFGDSSSDEDEDSHVAYATTTRDTLAKIQMSLDTPFESSLFAAVLGKVPIQASVLRSTPSTPNHSASPSTSSTSSTFSFAPASTASITFPSSSSSSKKSPTPEEEDDSPRGEERDEPLEATDMDGVPKSMAEIYKLSNRNRKRNKEKKKLKEESISRGCVSPVQFEGEGEGASSSGTGMSPKSPRSPKLSPRSGSREEKKSKRQKNGNASSSSVSASASTSSPATSSSSSSFSSTIFGNDGNTNPKQASLKDTHNFMKKIGWVDEGAELPLPSPPSSSSSGLTALSSSASSSSSKPGSSLSNSASAPSLPLLAAAAISPRKSASPPLPASTSSESQPQHSQQKPRRPKSQSFSSSGTQAPKHQSKSPQLPRNSSTAASSNFVAYDYSSAPSLFNPSSSSSPSGGDHYNPYGEGGRGGRGGARPKSNSGNRPQGSFSVRGGAGGGGRQWSKK